MASKGALALLRFVGTRTVLEGLTLLPGHVYRVILFRGCGSFAVRIYDQNPQHFADCCYRNLEAFMRDWEVVENER